VRAESEVDVVEDDRRVQVRARADRDDARAARGGQCPVQPAGQREMAEVVDREP
jgi:hypothetical protein